MAMKSTKIMAIINLSPDSFSGDGIANQKQLVERLKTAIAAGADILDIGGQSTRPGAEVIDAAEEIRRVVPAIQAAQWLIDLPISVDTFKAPVAAAALEHGATIINDIQGGSDADLVKLVAQAGAEIVVMHSRGTPQTMASLTDYPRGVIPELLDFFRERTEQLMAGFGIAREKIIIDPGIGFAKTAAQSFEVTQRLAELQSLGFPILYGASQKSFLGWALTTDPAQQAPVTERTTGTTTTTVFAMLQGADIIRVHDVKAAVQARRVLQCIADPVVREQVGPGHAPQSQKVIQ